MSIHRTRLILTKQINETSLPPKDAFYYNLYGGDISDEDYQHAQTVWKEFNIKTIKDYNKLYNMSDVLMLSGIFENFRDIYKKHYAWYFTVPGLAWDAALKITKDELELLSDPDMLLMIESGIRGGIATILHRYA